MKHPVLVAEARTVLGKKVKKLRREGILPGNVYGQGNPSVALQVKTEDFKKVYKEAGDTGVISLEIDGKSKPVLVKSMHMDFRTRTPLHVDFYQVNMKQKVKATVPVVLTDEAQAVTDKVGLLLQSLSEVEVEALPDKLPENLEVSVEKLAAIGDQVTVEDLASTDEVTVLTDPAQIIAKIVEPAAPEPEPEEEATEGEAENETAEGEATEGGEETTKEEGTEEKSETPDEKKEE